MSKSEEDKVAEYFKLKKQISTLRKDLRDLTSQHEDYEELQKLKKKVKVLNEKVKDDETLKEIREKTKEKKERMDLLKEMIRIDLIETSQESVKREGKVLKLVYVLREVKDEE